MKKIILKWCFKKVLWHLQEYRIANSRWSTFEDWNKNNECCIYLHRFMNNKL